MPSYNAHEAAKILGLNERTIRRWLESKKMSGVRHGRDWVISAREVERMRRADKKPDTDGLAKALEQVAELEAKLRRSEELRRMTELTYGAGRRPAMPVAATPAPPVPAPRPALAALAPARSSAVPGIRPGEAVYNSDGDAIPDGLPMGSRMLQKFAIDHFITRATVKDQVGDKRFEITRVPVTNGMNNWVTPEQQYKAVQYWQAHSSRYTPCTKCPHKPVVSVSELQRDAAETRPVTEKLDEHALDGL